MEQETKSPGLKRRRRKGSGRIAFYWCASVDAIAKGYTPKTVPLTLEATDEERARRCALLQAEMNAWLAGHRKTAPAFNGTWAALLKIYQTDPESSYKRLKPGSLHPYTIYLGKLIEHIGERRIDACDGRDVRRWFDIWKAADDGAKPKLAAARMCLTVLKAALSFGVECRLPGCVDFVAILARMEFEAPRPRTSAPTVDQITAARAAAHAAGRPSRALAYALQWETTTRQWDVIGQWFTLADPRPSAVLGYGLKWFGPTWEMVDKNLVLRLTPSKTEGTTEARTMFDLALCPMVVEEISRVPVERRVGPLIPNEKTGLPYRYETFREGWSRDRFAAGIPKTVWNRDFRAGGNTEGQKAGAARDDRRKIMGHTTDRMTAEVYDRDTLEAHRRIAKARKAFRDGDGV